MPNLSVMIKPASADCNLQCDYCFYRAEASSRRVFSTGRMRSETARILLDCAYEYARKSAVNFTFQGGEPLLAGYAFFKDFFKTAIELKPLDVAVNFSVQTNGTLLTDDFCRLFKRYGVLIGLSLDGTPGANCHRLDTSGKNSFSRVLRGAELLKKHAVDFNVLTVVTKETTYKIAEIYRFFKSQNFRCLQFIPCLPPFPESKDAHDTADASPSNQELARFLKQLFDMYERDFLTENSVSVRQFDNYIALLLGRPAEQCGLNGVCSEQFVVEADGSVYPCDFYCNDRFCLGNICENDFDHLKNDVQKAFLSDRAPIKDACKTCRHFFLCRGGGCKRAASIDYCAAYADFFDYADYRFKRLAQTISNRI